jgi:hypothetical protein
MLEYEITAISQKGGIAKSIANILKTEYFL